MSLLSQQSLERFTPPAAWSREEVLAASDAVLAMPPGAVMQAEDIFRIEALGLEWDIGVRGLYARRADRGRRRC